MKKYPFSVNFFSFLFLIIFVLIVISIFVRNNILWFIIYLLVPTALYGTMHYASKHDKEKENQRDWLGARQFVFNNNHTFYNQIYHNRHT